MQTRIYAAPAVKGLTLSMLITTIVVLSRQNHCYREWNGRLNIKICKYLYTDYTNMSNFQPVVYRYRDTQL